MAKYDVITVGSALMDIFVDTGIHEVHKKMCYNVGTKISVRGVEFATGGGGTNTAASFSTMGLKTGFVGKLGKDSNAEMILEELKKFKVGFLGKRSEEKTGFSVILDSVEHERTVLTYKGASDTLLFSEIPLSKLKTNWFYFSSMMGVGFETLVKLGNWAGKNGAKIAFNPSSYLAQKGAAYLKPLLKNVEIIILNDEEARYIVPKGDMFEGLHKLGPNIVCITSGPKGNTVSSGEKMYTALPNDIKVVERTGAGDAFASGFLSGYIKTGDVRAAVIVGSLNAEGVIQIKGAKNGLQTWSQIQKSMKDPNCVKIVEKLILRERN